MAEDIWSVQVGANGYVRLVSSVGSDDMVVSAARVSYLGQSKGPDKDKALIDYLMRNRHMSPFEYVTFIFCIKAPLFVRSQIFRHRTASMNEVSRRYTSDEIDFFYPEVWRAQGTEIDKQQSGDPLPERVQEMATNILQTHSRDSLKRYQQLIDMGVSREQARMVLPLNLMTKFYWKMDMRNLFNFLEQRNHPHAQYETRLFAQAIEGIAELIAPWSFEAWRKHRNGGSEL